MNDLNANITVFRDTCLLFSDELSSRPLFPSDNLRLFMQESPAPLQTSFQYEGWRGIKREGGKGQEWGAQKSHAFQKTLKN